MCYIIYKKYLNLLLNGETFTEDVFKFSNSYKQNQNEFNIKENIPSSVFDDETNILTSNKYTNQKDKKCYTIIKYNKEKLTVENFDLFSNFRSVILNEDGDMVVFSPPKATNSALFMFNYPANIPEIIAEEIVEGTMINMFFNKYTGNWDLATKNAVGGFSLFFKNYSNDDEKKKSFRDMFCEALKHSKLDITLLNTEYCYSFVLQHPNNRIVVPISKTAIYLIEIYKITQDPDKYTIEIIDKKIDFPLENGKGEKHLIQFPKSYQWDNSYDDLIKRFCSYEHTPYTTLGVMIKNTLTRERIHIRNPLYEEIKRLRGNQPKDQYHFYHLKKINSLITFLNYYPEKRNDFSRYDNELNKFIKELYDNYVDCYIYKNKPLKNYDKKFKQHMYLLHESYKSTLKPDNKYVTQLYVKNYIIDLEPAQIMFSVNYDYRNKK